MANNIGNTYQNSRLNWLRGTSYPAALANTYLALFTVAPTNAGGGTEVSGTGYARVAIPSSGWTGPTGNSPAQLTNTNVVNFGTTGGSWGTVVAWALMDALTVGNIIYQGTATSTAIGTGVQVTIAAGVIVLQED